VELEVVVRSQAEKIAELEVACADLKRENKSVAAGYWRLSEKHKAFIEKTKQEKVKLAEIHATELARLRGIWIWRRIATRSTVGMCGASFTNFMKQLHRHLRKSGHSVCPSLAKV
jgi:hypothetical protein